MRRAAGATSVEDILGQVPAGGVAVNGYRTINVTSDGMDGTALVQAANDAVGPDGFVIINGSGMLLTSTITMTCAGIVPAYGRPIIRTNINDGSDVFQVPPRQNATQNIHRTIGPFVIDKASGFSGKPLCGALRTGQGANVYARRNAQYRIGTVLTYVISTVRHLYLVTNHGGTTGASAPTLTAAAGNYTDGTVNLTYIGAQETGVDTYPEVNRIVRTAVELEVRNLVGSVSILGWQNKLDLSIQDCDYSAELAYVNGSELFVDQRNTPHGLRLADTVNANFTQYNKQSTSALTTDATDYWDDCLEVRAASGYIEVPAGSNPGLWMGQTVRCRSIDAGPFTARDFTATAGIPATNGGTAGPFTEALVVDQANDIRVWGTGDQFDRTSFLRVTTRATAGSVALNGVAVN